MYVAVTGGIGSGKSTFANLLGDLGAQVIHADELARQVLSADSPLVQLVVERFGPSIKAADGGIDRAALASIVFADPSALAELESLTHPEVARLGKQIRDTLDPQDIVIYDVPLLVEKNMAQQFDAVIVVQAPVELRLERLASRGVDRLDALARIDNQASDEQRRAVADFVVDNSDGLLPLQAQAEAIFSQLKSMSSR